MISKTSPNGSRMMSKMHFQPEQLFDLDLDQVTLLALYAHPDDETYLAGGLMAAVARAGGRVVHVTATLGELGTSEPDRWPPACSRTSCASTTTAKTWLRACATLAR